MNRATQLKLQQLLVIVIAWVAAGFLITVYDHLIINSHNSAGPSNEYSFVTSMVMNLGAGLIGSLLGGSILVFFVNVKYQDKPYGYTILIVSICFILILALIIALIGIFVVPHNTGIQFSDPAFNAAFRDYLNDTAHVKSGIAWFFVVAITQLLLQVNSKFGQSNFWNIIRGKYNSPREETRIFMFLDLNSSTKIAENIGDEKYHSLLKDFFADITAPIVENKGSVYQYVGDEVVIAWNYEDGVENQQCLKCFFDMKARIQKKKTKYMELYGLFPTFKAGIHCGKVIAGEIGIVKRDITYSGNVLNTTSRILNKCSELDEEIIASADLLSEIHSLKNYITRPLGAIKLKGKKEDVLLNALIPVSQ